MARLEHINITVDDPKGTSEIYCKLFDWQVRWWGQTDMGLTYHVGEETSYIALFSPPQIAASSDQQYKSLNGMNHIAVVVENLDDLEQRVIGEGFTPKSHANYEPGRRFYFFDHNGIEIEAVQYD